MVHYVARVLAYLILQTVNIIPLIQVCTYTSMCISSKIDYYVIQTENCNTPQTPVALVDIGFIICVYRIRQLIGLCLLH